MNRKSETKDKCPVCQKAGGCDSWLSCEICDRWFHTKCVDISDDTYKVLQKIQNCHWYCTSCDNKIGKIIPALGKISDRVDGLERALTQMDQKLEKQAKDLEEKIQTSKTETILLIESKKQQIQQTVEQQIENSKVQWSDLASDLARDDTNLTMAVDKRIENKMSVMSTALNSTQDLINNTRLQAAEEREKERRKNNIVIYRVPESTGNLLKDRTADDTKTILKFFNQGLNAGVDEQEILKVIRLGRFNDVNQSNIEDGSSPLVRPLLVSFNNYAIKNLIMNSLYKLKSSGHLFKSFIVTHDMTEMERSQCKEKVQEARLRSVTDGTGEFRYVVRGQPGRMEVISVRNRHQ